jgi:hypothetical protein
MLDHSVQESLVQHCTRLCIGIGTDVNGVRVFGQSAGGVVELEVLHFGWLFREEAFETRRGHQVVQELRKYLQ